MKLYIVRGLPGSGKSTYAKSLNCFHVEADMFHVRNKVYYFDTSKCALAHHWCSQMVFANMQDFGIDIVVSNTFVSNVEIQPYLILAKRFGYEVEVITLKTRYGNIHDVPTDVLDSMSSRWQDVDGEQIIK